MSPVSIKCLGLSHQTAPVELRERLTCSLSDFIPRKTPGIQGVSTVRPFGEIVVLSTCNRLEIYACLDNETTDGRSFLIEKLSAVVGVSIANLNRHIYYLVGPRAVEHLFSVAAGLDSMILGEPQILGQVADAYQEAVEEDTVGPVLDALFRAAIRVGKRARTETSIGNNPATISSIAIAKAQQVVGDLRLHRSLVVGMGEMGQLAMRSLQSRGVRQIAVANRSAKMVKASADGCVCDQYLLSELEKALENADIVISATAAPHTIIKPEMVMAAMDKRSSLGQNRKDLVLVDIAVPRDIDPEVGDIPGVHLFDMDDLQESLDEALAARRDEMPKVQAVIEEEVANFESTLRQIAMRPLIVELRRKAEGIRQRELERSLRFMGDVDPKTLEQIHLFSRSLVNKLLHEPTIRLKDKVDERQAGVYADALRHLFSLESPNETELHET